MQLSGPAGFFSSFFGFDFWCAFCRGRPRLARLSLKTKQEKTRVGPCLVLACVAPPPFIYFFLCRCMFGGTRAEKGPTTDETGDQRTGGKGKSGGPIGRGSHASRFLWSVLCHWLGTFLVHLFRSSFVAQPADNGEGDHADRGKSRKRAASHDRRRQSIDCNPARPPEAPKRPPKERERERKDERPSGAIRQSALQGGDQRPRIKVSKKKTLSGRRKNPREIPKGATARY